MSDHSAFAVPEVTYHPEHASGTGRIWKVFWILSAITIVELAMGYSMTKQSGWVDRHSTLGTFFVGSIAILSMAKAYYIVSIFMHLGDEIRNFRMTIVVPLMLFIWFIIAFLWDGNSWRNLRNTNAGSRKAPTEQTEPAKAHGVKD